MKSPHRETETPSSRPAAAHCDPADHAHPVPRPAPDPRALDRAARLFRAMGDAPRLAILNHLAAGEVCVGEIVAATGEKFSTVSQRLRVLRAEGLVARRRAGSHVYYALADRHVTDLVANALAHAGELNGSHPGAPAPHPEEDE